MASSHIRPDGGLADGKWTWVVSGFFLFMLLLRCPIS